LAAVAALAAGALTVQAQHLGTIDFPNSGAPAGQQSFIRGVLLLHSFEYELAAASFREAQQIDPGFALAYWGEALTYTHPVWDQQDLPAARAVLQRLGSTPATRQARAPTPREQAYLAALETLYGDGSKARRDTAYSAAMGRLVARFPTDQEAKVFYAASILGLNQGVRDSVTYMRAAAILETVFRANPTHPGAAHLLIHCYDDPGHARLGLPAARAYAAIAPDSPHAHHMTTHIFLALGMWDEVVAQNEIAAGRDRTAWTPTHYTDWLGYGYLQQGRYGEALRHLDLIHQNMSRGRGAVPAVMAEMRADYVVNTERWDCPCLGWDIDLTGMRTRDRALDAFLAGYSALKRGDRAGADRGLAAIVALNPPHPVSGTTYQGDAVPFILEKELRALLRTADGSLPEAISLMREATTLEDAIPFEFGPPAVAKPSHELFGEILLQAGRPREAQAEFAHALRLAPRRALSLLGLGRAAAAAGDREIAARAYADLREIWYRADPGIRGLAEAEKFQATVVPPPRASGRSG
jgi:tetratricopeptide (TPR) repeat protein